MQAASQSSPPQNKSTYVGGWRGAIFCMTLSESDDWSSSGGRYCRNNFRALWHRCNFRYCIMNPYGSLFALLYRLSCLMWLLKEFLEPTAGIKPVTGQTFVRSAGNKKFEVVVRAVFSLCSCSRLAAVIVKFPVSFPSEPSCQSLRQIMLLSLLVLAVLALGLSLSLSLTFFIALVSSIFFRLFLFLIVFVLIFNRFVVDFIYLVLTSFSPSPQGVPSGIVFATTPSHSKPSLLHMALSPCALCALTRT